MKKFAIISYASAYYYGKETLKIAVAVVVILAIASIDAWL